MQILWLVNKFTMILDAKYDPGSPILSKFLLRETIELLRQPIERNKFEALQTVENKTWDLTLSFSFNVLYIKLKLFFPHRLQITAFPKRVESTAFVNFSKESFHNRH